MGEGGRKKGRNRGWDTISHPLPLSPVEGGPDPFTVGPLLGVAVIEWGAQQVVEQQDGPTPQLQPLPPGQALPVTQEAQTGERRGHS